MKECLGRGGLREKEGKREFGKLTGGGGVRGVEKGGGGSRRRGGVWEEGWGEGVWEGVGGVGGRGVVRGERRKEHLMQIL